MPLHVVAVIRCVAAASLLAVLVHANAADASIRSLPEHAAQTHTDWPQVGFDAGHSGFNPDETLLGPQNVAALEQAWITSTGRGNDAKAVIFAAGMVYASSANGTVFAIDATRGRIRWTFAAGDGYETSGSAPAYDDGMLYTLCDRPRARQGICALDAASGALRWSYAVAGRTTFAATPPVVASAHVYFGGCGSACTYVALQKKSGRVAWSTAEPSMCPLNTGVAPAAADGLVFAGIGCEADPVDSFVIALSERTGVQAWEANIGYHYVVQGFTAAHGRLGVVTSCGGWYDAWLFDATDGARIWEQYTRKGAPSPRVPAIAYGNLYAPAKHGLFAFPLDPKPHGRLLFYVKGDEPSAAVANGVVYTLSYSVPAALSASTGETLWQATTGKSAGFPIVVNGSVYAPCSGAHVCAWRLPPATRVPSAGVVHVDSASAPSSRHSDAIECG